MKEVNKITAIVMMNGLRASQNVEVSQYFIIGLVTDQTNMSKLL
jgi:hypothetical protein